MILRPAFIFKQLSGDTYKNKITSDNFYGRETGSVEEQRLREKANSLLGVSLGIRVWRKEENGGN